MRTALVPLALLLVLPAVFADEVHLKSGGVITGIAVEEGDKVTIENLQGKISVPADGVKSIDKTHTSVLEEYYAKAEKIGPDGGAQAHLELALWIHRQGGARLVSTNVINAARQIEKKEDLKGILAAAELANSELGDALRPVWERVLMVDPENELARRRLGFRFQGGRWVSDEEFHTALGEVKFEGKWMTQIERELILNERLADFDRREALLKKKERLAADREKDLAKAEEELESTKKLLRREREELARLEAETRAEKRKLEGLHRCALCDSWYRNVHICPAATRRCPRCRAFHAPGVACPP